MRWAGYLVWLIASNSLEPTITHLRKTSTTNPCRAQLHMHRAPPLAHTHPRTEGILFVPFVPDPVTLWSHRGLNQSTFGTICGKLPAPNRLNSRCLTSSAGQSAALRRQRSEVRILSGAPLLASILAERIAFRPVRIIAGVQMVVHYDEGFCSLSLSEARRLLFPEAPSKAPHPAIWPVDAAAISSHRRPH